VDEIVRLRAVVATARFIEFTLAFRSMAGLRSISARLRLVAVDPSGEGTDSIKRDVLITIWSIDGNSSAGDADGEFNFAVRGEAPGRRASRGRRRFEAPATTMRQKMTDLVKQIVIA
jgi:hypothetical protein